MSEESECVQEEIDEDSFNPVEWIEWFDHCKDEMGDWIQDDTMLKEITEQFIRGRRESESDSSAENEKDSENEEEEEDTDSEEESRKETTFERKLEEFTDFAKDYLMSKRSTLVDGNRPYQATNPKFWFYKEFREYLENQGFIENMVEVLVKMFSMHPELPKKPLLFIRDNYGISEKEEDRLIAEWSEVSEEMVMLQDEGKALEKRIKWRLKQPREQDSTTESEPPEKVQSSIRGLTGSERPKVDETLAREESTAESSSFHWVCSDPSSVLSSPSSVRPVGSEITLVPFEEEEPQERSVTPQYEYDDFKRTDSSSSSLDIGSIELDH